jgi:hypothetical protein
MQKHLSNDPVNILLSYIYIPPHLKHWKLERDSTRYYIQCEGMILTHGFRNWLLLENFSDEETAFWLGDNASIDMI